MRLIRPAARATLRRWAEPAIGAGLVLLGLFWALAGRGWLLNALGGALALGGAALAVAGVQRLRFRRGSGGPGVVEVTEGRIAYFGPLTGGTAALSEITALWHEADARPAHWRIARPGEPPLMIPVTAQGADALFDTFTALPGLSPRALLRAQERESGPPLRVWTRDPEPALAATKRLH